MDKALTSKLEERASLARSFKFITLFFIITTIFLIPTSYARTTLTEEEATYIWEYFFTPTYSNQIYGGQYKNFVESFNNSGSIIDYSDKISSFRQYFNQNNDLDISENTWFFVNWHSLGTGFILYWFNFNNTISSELPYLALDFSNTSDNTKKKIKIYAIDDNQVKVNNYGRLLKYHVPNDDFYDYGNNTLGPTGKTFYLNLSGTWTNTETTLSPIAGITNLARLPESVLYSNWNGNTFFSPYNSYFYKNLYNPIIDTGTGTITNESGEIIGNIDLSGIQNGIGEINNSVNNQGEAIVNGQDENTDKIINKLTSGEEAIVGAITQQNENYWGNSGELTGEQQSGEAQEMITSIIETASGELASGEISATLNTLEKGITDMFVFGRENPEMLDFIVSWQNIEYENKILIPSGEINFSKICRDNETLKTLKAYIQTICVFWAGWGLICQIWNLLLATLGIDNPYLYKEYQPDDTVSTVIDTSTGEIKGQYYTRRRRVR